MADKKALIEQCLSATKGLRSSLSHIYEDFVSKPVIKDIAESSDAVKSSDFVTDLKKHFGNIQKSVSNIEKSAAQVSHIKTDLGAIGLGSVGLVSLDPGDDKTQLYRDLVGTYNWHEKINSQSQQSLSCLKRIHPCSAKRNEDCFTKRPRYGVSTSKSDLERLEKVIQLLRQKHSNLRILLFRVSGALMLEVAVPKTFKAMVLLKGYGIDQVIIRGIHENILNDQKEDMWTSSKYAVFQKLTDNACSAFLYYSTTGDPVVQIVNFMKWLDSFHGLFSKKCVKCGVYLKEDDQGVPVPPCWRAYDSFLPYHYKCYTMNTTQVR